MAVVRDILEAIHQRRGGANSGSDLFSTIDSFAQTAAESAAGITPVNFSYPPGSVDRYGTNTVRGTTDMTAALQAAVSQAKVIGGSVVTLGLTGLYRVTGPIDGTTTGQPNQQGIIIRGVGGAGQDLTHGIFSTATTGHVLDFTGTDSVTLEDFNICTAIGLASGDCPITAILWARNVSGASTIHRMTNVKILGSFSNCCLYNYACEDNLITGCYFDNRCTSANTRTRVYTGNNISGLTSTFTTIAAGGQSNTDHTSIGCQDNNSAGTSTSDCIYLEGVDGFASYGGWAYSASASANGRSLFFIDQSIQGSADVRICGLKGETAVFQQQYGVATSNHVVTMSSLIVDGCFLPNANACIASLSSTAICDNFYVRNISEQASHGISIPGTLQASFIQSGTLPLTLGTSKTNTLSGFTENWTITTRNNDYWIDQGNTNKTWTPALGTVTHGGSLTINENSWLYSGSEAAFEFLMTDTVSITATAGQTITGLKVAALRRSAMVLFANESTGIAIGAGFIEAGQTAIKCPAFTVGAGISICVSGRYFIA